jgi:hypothetical protein
LATDPEARVRLPALPEKKVVDLERGPLSILSTTEELLDGKGAAPVSKTENTAVGIRHADHVAPSIRNKLAITSPTSGGRSVGIVRSRTQTMEFFFWDRPETEYEMPKEKKKKMKMKFDHFCANISIVHHL